MKGEGRGREGGAKKRWGRLVSWARQEMDAKKLLEVWFRFLSATPVKWRRCF